MNGASKRLLETNCIKGMPIYHYCVPLLLNPKGSEGSSFFGLDSLSLSLCLSLDKICAVRAGWLERGGSRDEGAAAANIQ
jgi:hypothetical protein